MAYSGKQMTEPQQKKVRPTVDLDAPGPKNFEDVWNSPPGSEAELLKPEAIFGSGRSWFVRESYVHLFDDIMSDSVHHTQIVNGTAGIGKSSFLLYMLARLRFSNKPVLLHYHINEKEVARAIFFPAVLIARNLRLWAGSVKRAMRAFFSAIRIWRRSQTR